MEMIFPLVDFFLWLYIPLSQKDIVRQFCQQSCFCRITPHPHFLFSFSQNKLTGSAGHFPKVTHQKLLHAITCCNLCGELDPGLRKFMDLSYRKISAFACHLPEYAKQAQEAKTSALIMGTAPLNLTRFCLFMLVKSLALSEFCQERQEFWLLRALLTSNTWRDSGYCRAWLAQHRYVTS